MTAEPQSNPCFFSCDDCQRYEFYQAEKCLLWNASHSSMSGNVVLDTNLITEIIGTLTITEGFVPTAIRSEVMNLREKLTKELRHQEQERER